MRAKRFAIVLAVVATVSSAGPGCLSGAIYEHVTVPLDTNFDRTPSPAGPPVEVPVRRSWKTLAIPLVVVAGRLEFHWGDASVAGAVRDAGLSRVAYADLERRSILGIWSQTWVRVYGE